jgi:hypothetical protein
VLLALQELLLKPVMAVLALAILLQALRFFMPVAVVGLALIPADCCLTPALVEQAAVVTVVRVRAARELTELQIRAVAAAVLRQELQLAELVGPGLLLLAHH